MTKLVASTIALIIIFFYSCTENKRYEKEPNSLLQNATPIKLNQSIIGNFKSINDKDTYILDLRNSTKENINTSITLTRVKDYDIAFSIYEGNKLIKTIDDYKKNRKESISSIMLKKNIYYIVAKISKLQVKLYKENLQNIRKALPPTQNYSLVIKEKPKSPFYEIEPNDNYKQASPVGINKFIEGSFTPFYNSSIKDSKPFEDKLLIKHLDNDWYYFDLPSEEKAYNTSILLEGKENIDSILGIYGNSVNKLIDDNKAGEGERIINLSLKANQRYYIMVSGIPHAYKYIEGGDSIYRLSISVSPGTTLTEAEINNSFSTANIITNNPIHGILSPKNDADYYIFKINNNKEISNADKTNTTISKDKSTPSLTSAYSNIKGTDNFNNKDNRTKTLAQEDALKDNKAKNSEALFASLSGVDNVDLALYLYDEFGKLLRIYDNNGEGEGEAIQSFNVQNMSKVIVCVKGSYHNKADNYNKAYKLEISLKKVQPNYELEPNDKLQSIENKNLAREKIYKRINKVKPNTMIYGFLNPSNKNPYQKHDVDNYEIKLEGNNRYEVTLIGLSNISATLSLYFGDGSSVDSFTKLKSYNKELTKSVLTVPHNPYDPDANIYKIKIETEFGREGNSYKPYRFIFKKLLKNKAANKKALQNN